jgi:hypothetical protein
VVEYYKQALKQLNMSGARESRNWRDLKVFYYSSVSAQWVVGWKGLQGKYLQPSRSAGRRLSGWLAILWPSRKLVGIFGVTLVLTLAMNDGTNVIKPEEYDETAFSVINVIRTYCFEVHDFFLSFYSGSS